MAGCIVILTLLALLVVASSANEDAVSTTRSDSIAMFGPPYYHHIPWDTFPDGSDLIQGEIFEPPLVLTPGFAMMGQNAVAGQTKIYKLNAGTNKEAICQFMNANGIVECSTSVETNADFDTVVLCLTPMKTVSDMTVLCTVSSLPNSIGCFSEDMTLQVEGKGPIAMKDVSIGDRILVAPSLNSGEPMKYQAIYGFGHFHQSLPMEYIQIYTFESPRDALELTGTHLIYAKHKGDHIRADQLKRGDSVLLSSLPGTNRSGAEAAYRFSEIVKVDRINREGAYLPLTIAGTIVVNGIYSSAYVSISDLAPALVQRLSWFVSEQTLFHWWLTPYRIACTTNHLQQVCLALTKYDENEGVLQWLVWGKHLVKFGDRQHPVVQLLGLILAFTWFLMWIVVEQVFQSRCLRALLIWLVMAVYSWRRRRRDNSRQQTKPKLS